MKKPYIRLKIKRFATDIKDVTYLMGTNIPFPNIHLFHVLLFNRFVELKLQKAIALYYTNPFS